MNRTGFATAKDGPAFRRKGEVDTIDASSLAFARSTAVMALMAIRAQETGTDIPYGMTPPGVEERFRRALSVALTLTDPARKAHAVRAALADVSEAADDHSILSDREAWEMAIDRFLERCL